MATPPSRSRKTSSRPAAAPAADGHRPLLLVMALAAGFAALPAAAQPTGAQAIHGAATLTQTGNKLTVITQNGAGTNHSAINWQSFSIPQGYTTHFAQPNAASTSINRVVAPNPSQILGTLSSNGRLVLVNPHGIAVGAGASIDTAGFTASTLRMSDADAIAGRLRFEGGNGAALRVDGQVLARQGDVVLIGQNVEAGREAVIQAPNGATVLGAGQKVQITGRGLEGIHFEVQAPTDQAVNLGTLQGDAVGIFAGTLRHSGLVQARAVTTAGGKVVLQAVNRAEVSGTVSAQGPGGAGGSVDVLGRQVGVLAGATIDTSNTASGGQIRVGGDYKGQNPDVPNAQVTYVDADATLRANATVQGDGGRVIVWADDTARVHGTIEARGGPQGGNGGLVETSGKRVLDVQQVRVSAAATAPAGQAGTWLLDPANLTIQVNGSTTAVAEGAYYEAAEGDHSVVTVATLNQALDQGSSVVLSTHADTPGSGNGDIIFDGTPAAGGEIQLRRTAAGSTVLYLDAAGDIVFRGATSFGAVEPAPAPSPAPTPAPRRLDVVLNAGRGGSGGIRSEAGSTVQLYTDHSDNDVQLLVGLGRTWTNHGTITLNLNGRITLAGPELLPAALVNEAGGVINGAAGPRGGIGGYQDGQSGAWGHLVNYGSIALAEGAVELASFTQLAGATSLSQGANLHVGEGFAVDGGTFSFTGRDIRATQAQGDLVLPSGSGIDATGSAALQALAGNLLVQGAIHADGQVSLAADPGGIVDQGAIRLEAPVTAGQGLALAASGWNAGWDASISQGDDGRIAAPELLIVAEHGHVRLTNAANAVDALAAAAYDLDLVNQADLLRIRALDHEGIAGPGWSVDGLVSWLDARIDNRARTGVAGELPAGSIRVDAQTFVDVGSLALQAAGDIVLQSNVRSYGGDPGQGQGTVRLEAAGDIEFLTIATQSESAGHTAGSVHLAAGGSIRGGGIHADGGSRGHGGSIVLEALGASGSIHLTGDLLAHGGGGGHGGQVLVQATGQVQVDGAIDASGGAAVASSSFGPGPGGLAGFISLASLGGSVTVHGLAANGGDGSSGQQGGVIQIAADDAVVIGSARADGGDGWSAGAGSGGAILVSAGAGGVTVEHGLKARGGAAGGPEGDAGRGGEIRLSAEGDIRVGAAGWADIDASGGWVTSYGSQAAGGQGGEVSVVSGEGDVDLWNARVLVNGGTGAWGGNGGTIQLGAMGAAHAITLQGRGGAGARDGGQGGTVQVQAAGSVELGSLDLSGGTGGSGAGGEGGDAIVQAGGDALVWHSALATGGDTWAWPWASVSAGAGGSITILAQQDIAIGGVGDYPVPGRIAVAGGSGALGADGGDGGRVTLQSLDGGVYLSGYGAHVDAHGGSGGAGGEGGSILVQAGGGSAELGWLDASGGFGGNRGGGDGGSVQVEAQDGISIAGNYLASAVRAAGGSAWQGGKGGQGGDIELLAMGGALQVEVSGFHPHLQASGGDGVAGGDGGSILVEAAELMPGLRAWALGGSGTGSAQAEGRGGAGGGITVAVGSDHVEGLQLVANGGAGWRGAAPDPWGYRAGDGGSIAVEGRAGKLELAGAYLSASGGLALPGNSSTRGFGGEVRVAVEGDLRIVDSQLHAAGTAGWWGPQGYAAGDPGTVALDGGSVQLAGALSLSGNAEAWARTGSLRLEGWLDWRMGNWLHLQGHEDVELAGGIDGKAGWQYLPGATVGLKAVEGSVVQLEGTVRAPRLYAGAGGDVLLEQANELSVFSAYAGGAIRLQNTGSLALDEAATAHGAATGLYAGGEIDIRAGGDLEALVPLRTRGGAVTLVAGEPSLGSGGGRLLVQGDIDTTWGGAAPEGADVTLQALHADGLGPAITASGSVDAGLGLLQVQGAGDVAVGGASWSAGSIEVQSEGADAMLSVAESTLSAHGDGGILVQADGDLAVSDASIGAAGGAVQLTSRLGGVTLVGSQLSSAGGDIRVEGGSVEAATANAGVTLWDSSLDAGDGYITVRGRSADFFSDAVLLAGHVRFDAAGGTWIEGWHALDDPLAEGGAGVRIGEAALCASDCITGSGGILIRGGSAASWHPGVVLGGAAISHEGAIGIIGQADAGPLGVRIEGSDIRTHGHGLHIDSALGVSIHASSVDTAGGDLLIYGGSHDYDAVAGMAAVDITGGSSLHAGAGNVSIVATTREGVAFHFASQAASGGVTISGTDVSIVGNTDGSPGLLIDNETITATHSITLRALGGSLEITDGSRIENTGTGPLILEAQSGDPSQPAVLRVGAGAVVTSNGDIRITADVLDLLVPLVTSGRIELVPLDLSALVTLGDGAGSDTINYSQAMLDLLQGDTVVIGGAGYTGGIRVLSAITVGNRTLSLVTEGDITQDSGATITAGSLVLDGRSVFLPDVLIADGGAISGRAFAGDFLVRNRTSGGTLAIAEQSGVAGVSATGTVDLTTGGELKLAAPVVSGASGNAIVLAATSLAGHAGGTLQTGSGGRWLVYLEAPTAGLAGAPVSGNHAIWNTTRAGTPPASITQSGNRYAFAQAPVVTISAESVARAYDGTTAFTLTPVYTGVVDAAQYGGVFEQDVATATLHVPNGGKDVGEYDIELASHALPEGYVFGGYHGAKARIEPRDVTILVRAQAKEEGKSLDFDGTEFDIREGDLVGSERIVRVTLQSAGAAASAVTGSYVITASDAVGDDGFIAGNYRITYGAGVLQVVPASGPPVEQVQQALQVQNQVEVFRQLLAQEVAAQQEQRAALAEAEDEKQDGADTRTDGQATRRRGDAIIAEESCRPA